MKKHVAEFGVFVGTMVITTVLFDLAGFNEFIQGALSALTAAHLSRSVTEGL